MSDDYTPNRLGQIEAAGDELALFCTKWAMEAIEAYRCKTIMLDLVTCRHSDNGKTMNFPVLGPATASYHVPGTCLEGGTILHDQRPIHADRTMISDIFIDNWDEVINCWDVRAPYTRAMSYALAEKTDKNLIQLVGQAARSAATITGEAGGSQLVYPNARTIGADLGAAIYEAAQKLDEACVPEDNRHALVRPAQYNALVQSVALINSLWGGSGSYADGTVLKIGGVQIHKTMHLPITDLSAAVAGEFNDYTANFANTAAFVFHPDAVGCLEWQSMKLEFEKSVRCQGTLIVAKKIMGAGVLRPEAAVEIVIA